jgi:hypothetical protein
MVDGTIWDVSPGGMGVTLDTRHADVPIGLSVKATVELQGKGEPVTIPGRVRYVRSVSFWDSVCGLEFEDLDREASAALARIISHANGDH